MGLFAAYSEVFPFAGTIFAFTHVILYRSVIDLGGCIVLEGIRLTADLRLVLRKALIALVNTFDDLFFRICEDNLI